jgi:hypothetical protein
MADAPTKDLHLWLRVALEHLRQIVPVDNARKGCNEY